MFQFKNKPRKYTLDSAAVIFWCEEILPQFQGYPLGYLRSHKIWLHSAPKQFTQYQSWSVPVPWHAAAIWYQSYECQKRFKYSPKASEVCSLCCFTALENPRTAHQPAFRVFFLHCSFSHILFLNNTFLSHEHILFQYHLCQNYFSRQRKTTHKLSAFLHTAYISLNAKAFAVFLT